MTHRFEIRIQCKGHAVGTLNWLNSILSDGELVIKNNKEGVPALFFHDFHDKNGSANTEQQGNTFICRVRQSDDGEVQYFYNYVEKLGVSLSCCYEVSTDDRYGFVDYPLTPAAFDKLSEFLDAAYEHFANWWKNQ